jgi:hypothetical protein
MSIDECLDKQRQEAFILDLLKRPENIAGSHGRRIKYFERQALTGVNLNV